MPAITITDLNNARSDVEHIAAIATSTAPTATDRLGHVKSTMAGAVAIIEGKIEDVEAVRVSAHTLIDADVAAVDTSRVTAQAAIDADVGALDAYRVAGQGLIDTDVATVNARKTLALVVDIPAAIASVAAINNRDAWVPGTAYTYKDIVLDSGTWYMCVVPHMSSEAFAADGAKWRVYQGVTAGTLAADDGSDNIGHIADGDGAVPMTVGAKLREWVSPEDYFLAAESDWTGAVRRAIRYCEDKKKELRFLQVYPVSDEIFIRKQIKITGAGSGSGYGELALTEYRQISGLLVKGAGIRRIRTRQRWRGTALDLQDAPLSVALNIQAENSVFRDFTVFLDFDRTDASPRNYGADWDCGIFVGTRVHQTFENVHVVGYWREADYWFDITRQTGLPQFPDPDGVPFEPGTVQNGGDGCTMIKCFARGGKWGLRLAGSQPKAGVDLFTDPYYDQLLGAAVPDARGSFGFSDFTTMACSVYGTDHHSNRRRDDPTGNYLTDTAGGAMFISGMNGSGRIQGMRFISTRFATFEPYRVRLDRCNRVLFIGSHIETRSGSNRLTSAGGPILFTGADTYGQISMTANTSNVLVQGASGAITANGFDAFIDPTATYHEVFSGTSGNISSTFHTWMAAGYRALKGELDLRSETNFDDVRLRGGSNTYATIGSNGVLFGSGTINSALITNTGMLDLRAAVGSYVSLRSGNVTTAQIGEATAYFTATGSIRSSRDNTVSSGSASFRYSQVYAGNNTISTSDAKAKQQRGALTDAELRAWSNVRPVVFQWIDAIVLKGEDAARFNAGYIAQDVQAAFAAEGLDASKYALWCSDELTETRIEHRKVMRAKTVPVVEVEAYIEVVDGRAVRKTRNVPRDNGVSITVQVEDEHGTPLFDEEGSPVMHTYAEMEEVDEPYEVEVLTGETRLGLRYGQCLVFECAYLRSIVKP